MSENNKLHKISRAKWRLGALLPLGAALSGVAFAAEPLADATASEEQEIILKDVKVKAAREKKSQPLQGRYFKHRQQDRNGFARHSAVG